MLACLSSQHACVHTHSHDRRTFALHPARQFPTYPFVAPQEISNKLRKLKALKQLPVYELVDKEITGFANSLPLMKELKSDALRQVGWRGAIGITQKDKGPHEGAQERGTQASGSRVFCPTPAHTAFLLKPLVYLVTFSGRVAAMWCSQDEWHESGQVPHNG